MPLFCMTSGTGVRRRLAAGLLCLHLGWCSASGLAGSPGPVLSPGGLQENPPPFPLDAVARDLAQAVQRRSGPEQSAFFYSFIPDRMRLLVFWLLPGETRSRLYLDGIRLAGQKLPHLKNALASIGEKGQAVFSEIQRAGLSSPSARSAIGTFLVHLRPEERQAWKAFSDQFFPQSFVLQGYRTLALTAAGARALSVLSDASPSLAVYLRQGRFAPERDPFRIEDGGFSISLKELPVLHRSSAPPPPSVKEVPSPPQSTSAPTSFCNCSFNYPCPFFRIEFPDWAITTVCVDEPQFCGSFGLPDPDNPLIFPCRDGIFPSDCTGRCYLEYTSIRIE